ncbi:MAG TPA: hypothetical protein VF316_01990 [Polyangiaceae bacterium]
MLSASPPELGASPASPAQGETLAGVAGLVFSASVVGGGLPHGSTEVTAEESDHGVNVGDNVVDRDPDDAIAKFRQRLVAPPVRVPLREVHATVDFHNEPSRGSQEVDDERSKDDLPTKTDAELSAP